MDYTVVIAYLVGIAYIGLRMARRQKTTEEYFLANRDMPGWTVGFSILGTIISSVSFVAFPGAAFAENWWLIVPNLMVPFVLLFVMIYGVPFYRRVVGMSSYEYLERRFGYLARLYGSTSFVLLRTVDLGFTLLLTSVAVEVMTGWRIVWVILGLGVFTIVYTMLGGLEAVIWTDVAQGFVLTTGALTVVLAVLFLPSQGPVEIVSHAFHAGKFGLGNFDLGWHSLFGARATFWMLALSGLLHFGRSYLTEQNMVQRYLVARSERDAQRGLLAGAVGSLAIWLTFMFIGSCLWAFYQLSGLSLPAEVAQKPDNILPYFIVTNLPQGLVGLILAAILSASNSTVSTDLNSVATVTTQDFFVRALPQSSDASRLWVGRLSVLIAGLMSTGVALLLTLARGKAMIEMIVILGMIFAAGTLGLFALGFLSRRATARGAYVGIAVCVLFVAWATATGPLGMKLRFRFSMHPLMIGILSHFILFGVGYAASLLFGGAQRDVTGLTIGRGSQVVRESGQ